MPSDAMRVWREACDATGAFLRFKAKPDQAAAAVIERAIAEVFEWQPIETAPKDGTAVWVATLASGHGTGSMEPAKTRQHHYGEWTNIYTGNSLYWQPTHWMPLPIPPGRLNPCSEGGE